MYRSQETYTLLIASYLEPEYVERIRQVDPRVKVVYESQLIPPPRYPADHTGNPTFQRDPSADARWKLLLARADILFDFDLTLRTDLPELAPNVLWVQATSAGIGQFVKRNSYHTRWPQTIFTTASGVHSRPLAEFVIMCILTHIKDYGRLEREQQQKRWQRYATSDLEDRTLAIVGLGKIGEQIAKLAKALGMRIVGTTRQSSSDQVDQRYSPDQLHLMLPAAEFLVLCAPHTPQTEKMMGARELALLPKGALLINIARGNLIDETALIAALRSGALGGAVLDVFEKEPLPAESPLWTLPNVVVSPHSASTSDRENQRLTDLMCDNLKRFLAGEPMRNVLDMVRLY